MPNAKRRLRSAILAGIAVVMLAAVALEFGGGGDVAHSAPDDVDITLVDVTILGADVDGDENTIEMAMTAEDSLSIPRSIATARIVKEITITVPIVTWVRVSRELAPPEGVNWHCSLAFVPGGTAQWDQGCTVGSANFGVVPGLFRGLPKCQWDYTNEKGVGPKVVMPWPGLPAFKCERFMDHSTLLAAREAFREGGGAPGCQVAEVTPAEWSPMPNPNPYNVGDCVVDMHRHFPVVEVGTITLRIVDEVELKPQESEAGKYDICEDFSVTPVGYDDPDLSDNSLTECFELNITGPVVGGITELLVDGSDSAARAAEGSAGSPPYAAIAGGIAAVVIALAAGAWYTRRRLS